MFSELSAARGVSHLSAEALCSPRPPGGLPRSFVVPLWAGVSLAQPHPVVQNPATLPSVSPALGPNPPATSFSDVPQKQGPIHL